MRSTFMGLETNKRGLYTQQSALYTTGHNISNANTLGYSRQRVNMSATSGFPGIGLNAGTVPGFLGTGVQAGSIQRIRDSFVDNQYRQESNKFGFWESKSKAISQMEDVLTEPSYYGLQKSLSEFWQSLQDVATNPSESGARAVAIRRGEAVADSFNYMHKSLTEIQTNLGTEIKHSTTDINSILTQIAQLNDQIQNIEPNGYLPNDLYDARDLLLDELSTYVPIEVEYVESGGRAIKGIAEGSVTVKLKLKNGTPVELVNGNRSATLTTEPNDLLANDINNPISGINIVPASGGPIEAVQHDDFLASGKLKSLMDSYGTVDGEGLYPKMLAELNKMAAEFAAEFNRVHMGDPNGTPPVYATDLNGNPGEAFFVSSDGGIIDAGNISVSEELLKDSSKFAASDSQGIEEGNGKNAKKLADIQFSALTGLGGATLETYFQGVIGDLGVEGLEANKMVHNTVTLLGAVEHRRASISSVSLDEEMTDMIRFQQAYNASARMITVVDETLDKIINGMGVVGR